MKYIEFKKYFERFPLILLEEIRKLEPSFDLRRLNEWQQQGYLKKICRGCYIFSDRVLDDYLLFAIANKMYPPSYVSLQMALSYYGIIPEAVYSISSISSRKTQTFNTVIGDFTYRHMKPELLFGFSLIRYNAEIVCKVAELEKALLDNFYLNTSLDSEDSLSGLRLNKALLKEKLNLDTLNIYLEIFNNKRLAKRIDCLLRYIKHADD